MLLYQLVILILFSKQYTAVNIHHVDKSLFISKEDASSILPIQRNRYKRSNHGVLEETTQTANFERECSEESCNKEEATEVFDLYTEQNDNYRDEIYRMCTILVEKNKVSDCTEYNSDELLETYQNIHMDSCNTISPMIDTDDKENLCLEKGTFECIRSYKARDCTCKEIWSGNICDNHKCVNGQPDDNGDNCICNKSADDNVINHDGQFCQNKICQNGKLNSANVCECYSNFEGEFCKKPTCKYGTPIEPFTEKYHVELQVCDCSGTNREGDFCEKLKCIHGVYNNDFDRCDCDQHYEGQLCAEIKCGSKGRRDKNTNKCVCDEYFNGEFCDERTCNFQGESENNKCTCNKNWTGENCDRKVHIEPCKEFYYGDDCNIKCVNGNYIKGQCACNEYFNGEFCDKRTCNSQGISENNKCACNTTWTGENCEACKESYYGDLCDIKCVNGNYNKGNETCEQKLDQGSTKGKYIIILACIVLFFTGIFVLYKHITLSRQYEPYKSYMYSDKRYYSWYCACFESLCLKDTDKTKDGHKKEKTDSGPFPGKPIDEKKEFTSLPITEATSML